jgi:hypothetical protein
LRHPEKTEHVALVLTDVLSLNRDMVREVGKKRKKEKDLLFLAAYSDEVAVSELQKLEKLSFQLD